MALRCAVSSLSGGAKEAAVGRVKTGSGDGTAVTVPPSASPKLIVVEQ